MKKANLSIIFFVLSVFFSLVHAESAFTSSKDIEGTWKLEYTKGSMTATETIPREDTWTFKDGKVTITNIPREGTHYDQPPVEYKIEDGKLKVAILGRSGRYETFSLVEKDDNNMTLKAKYGSIYQFKKK